MGRGILLLFQKAIAKATEMGRNHNGLVAVYWKRELSISLRTAIIRRAQQSQLLQHSRDGDNIDDCEYMYVVNTCM